jgi:hypothetical protein
MRSLRIAHIGWKCACSRLDTGRRLSIFFRCSPRSRGASLREADKRFALDRGCAPEDLLSSPARRRPPPLQIHRFPVLPHNLSSTNRTKLVAALMRTAFQ